MPESCSNCGKPVLATDTVCWHCGYRLTKRPKTPRQPVNEAAAGNVSRAQTQAGGADIEFDLRALAVYSLLTLAVILGLWLVMRSLRGYPILVRSAGLDLGGNWVAITDVNLRYTLSVPTDWQWLDVAFRDQSEMLEQLTGRQPYIAKALGPLGGPAGDVTILAVAVGAQDLENPEPQPFIVIGQSGRLRELTPQAALDLLTGQSLAVSEVDFDTRLAGQPQARFNVLDLTNGYQCRHLFARREADEHAYLVAACAPQGQFAALTDDLENMLDSFQILE